jgi:arylsulfatase A-like enzyme
MRKRMRFGFPLVWLSMFGCAEAPSVPLCDGCNVLLVVVDTLRADHLGIYGYPRETSPNIDRFARESTVFTDSRSQASCTYPSVNSLLTSRYPEAFLNQPEREGQTDMGIPEGIESIAEILKQAGYRTVAVSGSPIVRDAGSPGDHNKIGGFERGFDVFETIDCEGEYCVWVNKPHAAQVNERAFFHLNALSHGDSPFLLYLHYMDVHDPYDPPGEGFRKFSRSHESSLEWIRSGNPNPIATMLSGEGEAVTYSEEDLRMLSALYDDEIFYYDDMFGELLETLKLSSLLENSIVVLVSDHGESFLEHGTIKHCGTLFDSEIRSPLILHVPGFTPAEFRDQPVGNIDVLPTVLDYVGVERDELGLVGQSLRPMIENDHPIDRQVYSAQLNLRSLYDGRFKLIFDVKTLEAELYDLRADPAEQKDASETRVARSSHLRDRLVEMTIGVDGDSTESLESASQIGDATEEHLRAIGYLQ